MKKIQYVITLDALSMQYIAENEELEELLSLFKNERKEIGGGLNIMRCHKKKASFDKTCHVFIENELIGQIYFAYNNKWRYANSNVIIFEIENHILYQLHWPSKVRRIEDVLNIKFLKYNSMDIAIDGNGIVKKLNRYTSSDKYKRSVTIRVGLNWNDTTKVVVGNTLGSRLSDKYISTYDKVSEILNSGKHYITQWWELAGMDISQQIERCEARFKEKELRDVDRRIESLENPVNLATIFKNKVGKYLEFSKNGNPKKIASVIDWKYFGEIQINKKPLLTLKATPSKRYRNTLRCLFEKFLNRRKEIFLYAFAEISVEEGLVYYVKRKIPRWVKENRLIG